jgi:hypothetical protein
MMWRFFIVSMMALTASRGSTSRRFFCLSTTLFQVDLTLVGDPFKPSFVVSTMMSDAPFNSTLSVSVASMSRPT